MDLTFEPFQKLSRMKRQCTITEKIDGTNAQLCFNADGDLLAGSRKRQIWPEGTEGKPKGCDNYGFARWAYSNKEALFAFLGEGRHFGEWCGSGIQRGYDLESKKFALFNTARFGPDGQEIPKELQDIGLTSVPVLFQGDFTSDNVDTVLDSLAISGSVLATGFSNPEGIVVYHSALRDYFKVTFEHDRKGKGPNNQSPS